MPDTVADVKFDAVIVGAGFAGLYMLHRLRTMGLSVKVFEAGSGVGGTWYWNRYPGARCDVESMQYSYQFSAELQQEWCWSERYAPQPEILRYANHVADRFDLRRDIQFNTRITAASWDQAAAGWNINTDTGQSVSARFCIMATGCLSSVNMPEFSGLDDFHGPVYHTGRWPHEPIDFTGQRVAVIGTGSSAIQSIPVIARQAEQLTVFQRTPNYAVPAHNRPLDDETQNKIKADYPVMRARAKQSRNGIDQIVNPDSALEVSAEERQRQYEARWANGGLTFLSAFSDLLLDQQANQTAAEFVRNKIRSIVEDPETAELLTPKTTFGCKRLCIDIDYFQTYNRANVSLVDVSQTPIEAITGDGPKVNGKVYPVDAIVLATGFDAMTGALNKIDIRGKNGISLREKWTDGPKTYLGLTSVGFPNLFTITGPGSPSVLTNMLPSIEQHVNWIADCIAYMEEQGFKQIEPTADAEQGWNEEVGSFADKTVYPSCNSWYLGANIPGKPRVFMPYIGGFPKYIQKCEEVVENGYQGFALQGN